MTLPLEDPPPPPAAMGPLCRCLACCCSAGEGHRSLEYREWSAALERWEESGGRGSSIPASAD